MQRVPTGPQQLTASLSNSSHLPLPSELLGGAHLQCHGCEFGAESFQFSSTVQPSFFSEIGCRRHKQTRMRSHSRTYTRIHIPTFRHREGKSDRHRKSKSDRHREQE
ncbi:hypothetical protein B0T26DRAFT_709522 [Lasiosphaeria miniovina]|uniref:Uncharacterized protein n=1 Tax=Lasiosphaeria miniovina TaxID=1954250 RepID=A0AA40AK51_9PEZI|nr:uncharacterized protein B0T26DRAFT_709522 [Lasiosphaeria miniovina]KAK0717313.1 hypothetical protein B0T26DRAFT_709522 [Lasiosphaeria miniovina]